MYHRRTASGNGSTTHGQRFAGRSWAMLPATVLSARLQVERLVPFTIPGHLVHVFRVPSWKLLLLTSRRTSQGN